MDSKHKKVGIALVFAGFIGFPWLQGEAADASTQELGGVQSAAAGTIEKTEGWSRAESRREQATRAAAKAKEKTSSQKKEDKLKNRLIFP